MIKTKLKALEEYHDKILATAVESEIQIEYFKGKDQDEVILEQPKRGAMGSVIMEKFTVKMAVEEQEKLLERNLGRLEVIEKKIQEEKDKEPRISAAPSGPTS